MTETNTEANATATQNYKLRQIMLSFSYLAYCGQGLDPDNPEAEILKLINNAMPRIPPIAAPNPTWRVVWGPATFTMKGAAYQDNMMFIAQNQVDKTQYVIAVRGTNFISDLDWLMEDLDILQMIPWGHIPGAAISESTNVDQWILWGVVPPSGIPGAGKTFIEFLKGETSRFANGINLCVTGHSLGGCVGGTLALTLKGARSHWDNKSQNSRVCTITFAGPTAGNAAFAAYSDQQFAGQGGFPGWDQTLGTNFDAVRCDLDAAPMAWRTYAVTIPSKCLYPNLLMIYNTPHPPSNPNACLNFSNLDFDDGLALSGAVALICPVLAWIIAPRNYTQVVAGAKCLTGLFNTKLAPATTGLEDYAYAFLAQAEYQHGSSYPALLNVPQLNDPNIIVTHLLLNKRRDNKPRGQSVLESLLK